MAQSSVRDLPDGVQITGAIATGYGDILTPDALSFVAKLHHTFESWRRQCHRAAEENTGRSSVANAEFFRLIREWTAEPYDKILDRNRR